MLGLAVSHVAVALDRGVLNDSVDLAQLLVGEHDIGCRGVLFGTVLVAEDLLSRSSGNGLYESESTHEDPGIGITCSPREHTHASESWPGVMPLRSAIAVNFSTMARLCLKLYLMIQLQVIGRSDEVPWWSPLLGSVQSADAYRLPRYRRVS